MKKSSLIMLIVGAILFVAGLVCLIVSSWDKIAGVCDNVKRKLCRPREYDDFADVDDLY